LIDKTFLTDAYRVIECTYFIWNNQRNRRGS